MKTLKIVYNGIKYSAVLAELVFVILLIINFDTETLESNRKYFFLIFGFMAIILVLWGTQLPKNYWFGPETPYGFWEKVAYPFLWAIEGLAWIAHASMKISVIFTITILGPFFIAFVVYNYDLSFEMAGFAIVLLAFQMALVIVGNAYKLRDRM